MKQHNLLVNHCWLKSSVKGLTHSSPDADEAADPRLRSPPGSLWGAVRTKMKRLFRSKVNKNSILFLMYVETETQTHLCVWSRTQPPGRNNLICLDLVQAPPQGLLPFQSWWKKKKTFQTEGKKITSLLCFCYSDTIIWLDQIWSHDPKLLTSLTIFKETTNFTGSRIGPKHRRRQAL